MTTIALTRTSSTYVTQASATSKKGSNPSTLSYHLGPKFVRGLLAFAIPPEAIAPNTQITGAVLEMYASAAVASTQTLRISRITSAWTASTVTWNTKPTFDAVEHVDVVKATVAKNGVIAFDVLELVRDMQAAGANYGFQLDQQAGLAAGSKVLNSGTYTPKLTITYSTGPSLPTHLSPATGQVVSVAKPALRIASEQLGTPVYEMQVQVDAAEDAVSPDFDSGWVDGTSGTVDLNSYVGFTALSPHGITSWRTRVRDIHGSTTAWTSWQAFRYEQLGTLTITEPSPSPDNQVTDPTPPVLWALSGQTQKQYRVTYRKVGDPGPPLWDSGVVTSADVTTSPAVAVATQLLTDYSVTVEVWDEWARVANGGAQEHVTLTREFTFELSAGVDPVSDFDVVDLDPLPFVRLSWTRGELPDQWQIVRDGQSVGIFDAGDLSTGVTDEYEFTDFLASPRREHTWLVRAIVDGETSAANPQETMTIEPGGLWLSQPDKDRYLPFITQSSQSVGLTEDGGTFNPVNATYGLRILSSLRGWAGTIVGEILATPLTDGDTGSELRDMFLAMRLDSGSPMILTLLDLNIKVVAFNMTIAPTPTIGRNEDYVYLASIEFIEVG